MKRNINEFPAMVQDEIRNTLRAYSRVSVWYENGRFHVTPGASLKDSYAPDHEYYGDYTAEEIFTEEERIINYMESFHDYPIEYKGRRDYKMLNDIGYDWSVRFKMVDGNLVIA